MILPLFTIGHRNVLLMALIVSVMAAEMLTEWGRELRSPLGVGLLGGGVVLMLM